MNHTFRKDNICTDYLANHALSLSIGVLHLSCYLIRLGYLLYGEIVGVTIPHFYIS